MVSLARNNYNVPKIIPVGEALRKSIKSSARFNDALFAMLLYLWVKTGRNEVMCMLLLLNVYEARVKKEEVFM